MTKRLLISCAMAIGLSRSDTTTRPKESSAMPVGRFQPSASNERMRVPETS
jgi:hypothetical protein